MCVCVCVCLFLSLFLSIFIFVHFEIDKMKNEVKLKKNSDDKGLSCELFSETLFIVLRFTYVQ